MFSFDATLRVSDPEPPDAGPFAEGPSLEGKRVGRYELRKLLGAGAMGFVYEAHDPKLNRVVAVKLLRQRGNARAIGTLSARMLREARAMARLKHPNVVAVYDVGEQGDEVFVAMELVSGGTLATWLAQQPRASQDVLTKFIHAGRGLAAAHDSGLVHRDFKPENVLIGGSGEVRVTDFGLAVHTHDDVDDVTSSSEAPLGLRLTRTGALVGTPAYMSPEQLRREPATIRSDIFSFCAALFESLYGVRPFEGATLESLRVNIMNGRVREVAATRVPSRIRHALLRGLRANPEERFASMHELLALLERHAGSQRDSRPLHRVAGASVLGFGALAVVVAALAARAVASPERAFSNGSGAATGVAQAASGLAPAASPSSAVTPGSVDAPGSAALATSSFIVASSAIGAAGAATASSAPAPRATQHDTAQAVPRRAPAPRATVSAAPSTDDSRRETAAPAAAAASETSVYELPTVRR